MPEARFDILGLMEYSVGQTITVTAYGFTTRLHVMALTSFREAETMMPDAKDHFVLAAAVFGDHSKVLWVADNNPNRRFYADGKVNGFPILLTDQGPIGIDGKPLQVASAP